MLGCEALGLLRSVHSAPWSLEYADVGEVVLQAAVVGVEEACPTDQRERENVLVVGSQQAASPEVFLLSRDLCGAHLVHPSGQPPCLLKPPLEIAIVCKLGQVLAADHELPAVAIQPVSEQ